MEQIKNVQAVAAAVLFSLFFNAFFKYKQYSQTNKERNLDYISTIKNFIIENFLFGDSNNLQKDTSFLDNGIIDSTGILELISFLEATYEISVDDHELIPENLDTLENINNFLKTKIKPVFD